MHDLRFAFRSLFKSPGFTVVAILTIAVGIGANTALFSIFNTLVLHPIDLPDAGKLVRVWTNNKERNVVGPVMSVPKFRAYQEQQTVFSGIAASAFNAHVLTREGAEPEQLASLDVTASFVPTLGLQLARGRNFTAAEDVKNGPPVCLLGYDIWKNRFGQRESLVGDIIMLNGVGTTVVGILPEKLPAPISLVQLLMPWPLSPPYLTDAQLQGGAGYLQITARLKPGVAFAQADAEVRTISQRYKQAAPGRLDANNENELRTWVEEQVGPVRPTFVLLLTAVGFVLLIACANVSSLFLGRLSARHKEIAVRLSLGATRAQLVRQFMVETAVFCTLAAALGVLVAVWSLAGVQRLLASQLQTTITLSVDGPTLGFTIGLSVLASLVIGLVPAWQASRVNLAEILNDTARGSSGGVRSTRFRAFLIAAEVALSVMLLIGSSLLLASFLKLQATPAGFSPRGVAGAFINLPSPRYGTKAQQSDFYHQVIEKLRSYAPVKFAAVTSGLPLGGNNARGVYAVLGQPVPPVSERPIAYMNIVSDDYFSLLRIPLKSGRLFAPTDLEKSPGICVITESFAHRLFPHETALGKIILRGQKADIRMEIVGVVGDVKDIGLNAPPSETMYLPLRQWGGTGLTIAASTDGDANSLQALLRSAVAAVDKTQAVAFFITMDTQVEQSLGVQRITACLTAAFAGIALVLSAVGLYSVLAYAVTQRTGEIGIRMALGAERNQVVGLVLWQGLKLVVIGLLVGLGASAAGARLLTSLLYEIEPLNPLVFGGVTVLFTLVAFLACLIPSLRASRVDPLVALRTE